jgi:DNA-binding transcriptional ArsR family regulator
MDVVLQAVADGSRRTLLGILRDHPATAGELADALPIARPGVSRHLRVLREAGLVRERRDGTRRLYSADDGGLEPLRTYLERFWDQSLETLKTEAEREERNKTDARSN